MKHIKPATRVAPAQFPGALGQAFQKFYCGVAVDILGMPDVYGICDSN